MKKLHTRNVVIVNTAIYQLLLELNWNYELLYNNSSVVVISKKKGNIYACNSRISNIFYTTLFPCCFGSQL